jgi:hypothetical protein
MSFDTDTKHNGRNWEYTVYKTPDTMVASQDGYRSQREAKLAGHERQLALYDKEVEDFYRNNGCNR